MGLRDVLKGLSWRKPHTAEPVLGPKSQTSKKRYRKKAKRDYRGILTVQELYEIAETNYTVSTVLDAVTADRTKEGWEWKQEDLGQDEQGQALEPDEAQKEKKDRAEKLMRQPNPQMTGKDLLKSVNYDLEVSADSFIEVVYGKLINSETGVVVGREPAQLWPVPAGTMFIMPVDETGRLPTREEGYAYCQKISGRTVAQWYVDEIIHVRANNQQARLYGRPKLLSVATMIGLQTSALGYNIKVFTGQKIPKQIVSLNASVDDIDRMLDQAEEKINDSPHNVPFIAGGQGAQVLKLMDSMRDMEFMSLVKYAERSIMARWRVPPVSIGISEAGGAGIVVGRTQIDKYWDMIEEGNEQISEELSSFFRQEMGLTGYYLHIPSARPEKLEQAQEDDIRIKQNSLTVNEIRQKMGYDPVDWGDQPFSPMGAQAVPAAFSLSPIQATAGGSAPTFPLTGTMPDITSYRGVTSPPAWYSKAVSPARQDHGETIQTDPEAQDETEALAAKLVGRFHEMRRELLELVRRPDIILADAQTSTKATGITQSQLLAEAQQIAAKYAEQMRAESIEPLLDAYLSGKAGAAMDLTSSVKFSTTDWQQLEALREAYANTGIVSFTQAQVQVIEDSLTQVADAPDLTTFRNLVEETMQQNLWREQWKLDRIARTSINRVSNHSRGVQYRDFSGKDDPEVTWITAQDIRVRPSHRALHGKTMALSEALAEIDRSINCRCRLLRTQSQLPPGVPSSEDLVKDISEAQQQARDDALHWYMGPAPPATAGGG
jgi:SPP1 gp7 family putative phage head morphogenesis protein